MDDGVKITAGKSEATPSTEKRTSPTYTSTARKIKRSYLYIITFLIMFVFWLIFSGNFDPFHITLGVISCIIVSLISTDLLFPYGLKTGFLTTWIKFVGYLPWLLYQILLANIYVLRLVFHPRVLEVIDPHIIEFRSRLQSEVARTTFANSITLTPGTITVNVSSTGRFAVHCIDDPLGESLPGDMEQRVAAIFEE